MSAKMGRPKAENPKDVDIKVRLDCATNQRLLAYCKANNTNRAATMRKGLDLLLSQEK